MQIPLILKTSRNPRGCYRFLEDKCCPIFITFDIQSLPMPVLRLFYKSIIPLFLTLILMQPATGRQHSSWTLLLLKKGHPVELKQDMFSFSATGFYLYENRIYHILLKNKITINGRLLSVKRDTLLFTNFLNEHIAAKNFSTLDTIAVPYTNLKLMSAGERNILHFEDYEGIFESAATPRVVPAKFAKLHTNDSASYELTPYYALSGAAWVYEENGKLYWYEGAPAAPKKEVGMLRHPYKKKNIAWFTPNSVDEINGLALGAWAESMKGDDINERDSLKVNGINLEINPIMLFVLIRGAWNAGYPDSLGYYHTAIENNYSTTLNGINVGVLATVGNYRVRGISVGGITTVVDQMSGICITGFNNFAYVADGLQFSLIRNRATVARGIQVGIYNKATRLRGIQLGLWNVNERRSLPFINWQFTSRHKTGG